MSAPQEQPSKCPAPDQLAILLIRGAKRIGTELSEKCQGCDALIHCTVQAVTLDAQQNPVYEGTWGAGDISKCPTANPSRAKPGN